ncbi:MAG: polyphenol oxidase family protein [Elusimicrobiales bacterium]|nr:polyphenol oxidase family protein [Elusimicrobiales bacterium]
MQTEIKNGLKLLRFDIFRGQAGLNCAVTTRQGGVSAGPYAGLNLGTGTGDKIENAEENLGLVCEALGAEPARVERMRQRHTANVAVLEAGGGAPPENTDALVTGTPGVPLLGLSADCALTCFYDPVHKAIAVAHSGWRGALLDVYGTTLAAMRLRFGTEPGDLLAAVGPIISAAQYPVREDFLEKLKAFYPDGGDKRFLNLKEGRHYFNLRELLRCRLEALGVRRHEFMHLCTYTEKELFYSWRRDGEKTGRFGLIATLT